MLCRRLRTLSVKHIKNREPRTAARAVPTGLPSFGFGRTCPSRFCSLSSEICLLSADRRGSLPLRANRDYIVLRTRSRREGHSDKQTAPTRVLSLLFCSNLFLRRGWVIRAPQNVIGGNVIEIRQTDQNLRRDIQYAPFVIAVYALAAHQNFPHFPLGQIAILAQISNPSIKHINTAWKYFAPIIDLADNTLLTFSGKSAKMML